MSFDKYIHMCNHSCIWLIEYFHNLQNYVTFLCSQFPRPWSQGTMNLLSAFIDLSFLDISHKCDHTICGLL